MKGAKAASDTDLDATINLNPDLPGGEGLSWV